MNKKAKKWLIAAACLVIIGAIVFAAGMAAFHWDFSRLDTDKFETNTYEIKEEFSGIKLNTETADILFVLSDDNMCRVVCYEEENMKHTVTVQGCTLTVSFADEQDWYKHIGFNFHSPKITVYLPNTEYNSLVIKGSTGNIEIPEAFSFDEAEISLSTGDVNCSASVRGSLTVKTSTGNISVNNASIGDLDITVSTGDVNVSDAAVNNLTSGGSTGDISLKNVIVTGNISLERSSGDVRFDSSDAAEIYVKTTTGDVTGSLLSDKLIFAETSTGDISLPRTAAGGRCEITTSTGDIKIEISGGTAK